MFRTFFLIFGISLSCFAQIETAYFSGGCFWGVEAFFEYERGVVKTTVGYMGGKTKNPTYQQVCAGSTGHLETVEVQYDSSLTTFTALAKFFFEIHDPSQKGLEDSQYRSAIFYSNESQKQISLNLINQLNKKGVSTFTELKPAVHFYPAEDYHQRYYAKIGIAPCKCHRKIRQWDS